VGTLARTTHGKTEMTPEEVAENYQKALSSAEAYVKERKTEMTEWTQWNGGECPVSPDTVVEYKIRNDPQQNTVYEALAGSLTTWKHRGRYGDIVAYRVVPRVQNPEVEWHGGVCPVPPDALVGYAQRTGRTGLAQANCLDWRHTGRGGDIVRYRLAEVVAPPVAEPEKTSALDVQVGGSHYKDFAIQPVEFIHANKVPFIEGNCIKYLMRWREKGGVKDLEKVKHYVDLLIDLETRKEPNP
jgi:hypothetical protein